MRVFTRVVDGKIWNPVLPPKKASPTPPLKKYLTLTLTVRVRVRTRAREASRKGSGKVGFRQSNGQGKVRIGRDLFFDPKYDPVQIALLGSQIPQRSRA